MGSLLPAQQVVLAVADGSGGKPVRVRPGVRFGMLNRRRMWALIWEPRPRTKRPELNDCRSFATMARVIGLRANATATAVPSVRVRD